AVDQLSRNRSLPHRPQPIHSYKKNWQPGRIWNHFQIQLLPEIRTRWTNLSDVVLQARDKWRRKWMDFNP
ncbi:hypothetical protein ACC679_38595, partial [Rhizobium ruizarguesonis]